MRRVIRTLLWAGATAALLLPVTAQSGTYPVKTLDFDLWCTEEEHLPYERCDQRLPEDVEKFEAYRAVVERYEIPYLQEKDNALHFDQSILRNDPVDKKPDSPTEPPPKTTDGR